MCDPATMTALAISAATTAGSTIMQNKAAGARSDAQLSAQRAFQEDLNNQRNAAAAEFQNNLQTVQQPQMQEAQQQAAQTREAVASPSYDQRTLLPGQGDASSAVRAAITQDQNRAIEANKGRAKSQALLEAFGDAELKRDVALKQNANRIGMYGSFAGGGLDNLQADLNAAQYAGNKYDNMAGIIQGLGTAASLAAPSVMKPYMGADLAVAKGPLKGAQYLIK